MNLVKLLTCLSFLFLMSQNIYSQDNFISNSCTYDPKLYQGRMVSGDFDNDGFTDDVAVISEISQFPGAFQIEVVESIHNNYRGSSVWFSNLTSSNIGQPTLDVDKMFNSVVAGDFDGDGFIDDIAIFYRSGNNATEIHVFTSTSQPTAGQNYAPDGSIEGSFKYHGQKWKVSGYDTDRIAGRIVSGDFDHDGKHDDIAALFDYRDYGTPGQYPHNHSRIHVWKGNNNGTNWVNNFDYQSSIGWWYSDGYPASNVGSRMVSGDFDRDGIHNDIATIYYYGNFKSRIHVWKGTGNGFDYQSGVGWWNSSGYNASQIRGQVVSGDFDRDGYDDGIAAFYDYGNQQTRAHVWQTKTHAVWGTQLDAFDYHHWWTGKTFNGSNIVGVFSGNFDHDHNLLNIEISDKVKDDILLFYNYGKKSDQLITFRNKKKQEFTSHEWELCRVRNSLDVLSEDMDNIDRNDRALDSQSRPEKLKALVYPNPVDQQVSVVIENSGDFAINIYDLTGRKVYQNKAISMPGKVDLDLNSIQAGVYFMVISNSQEIYSQKIIKE